MLLVFAGTACEPPPPRPVLEVTSTVDAPDAAPGDGVCEVSPGAGDCSLRAAIDEGNALGRALITVPEAAYQSSPLIVTGDLIVTASSGVGWLERAELFTSSVHVAPGGRLEMDGFDTHAVFTVEGNLVGRHLLVTAYVDPTSPSGPTGAVDVLPGATAGFQNSILGTYLGAPVVHNRGTLVLHHVALDTYPQALGRDAALSNEGAAYTAATLLQGCEGTMPTSLGYNGDADGSCGLGPTEHPLSSPYLPGRSANPSILPFYRLPTGSPLIDAIPEGTLGCGASITDDLWRTARPTDGDEDGTTGCDIGAFERYDDGLP